MATAAVEKRIYTAEELYQLSRSGGRYELVKGELREMPPAGMEHGFKGMRLAGRFAAYVYANDLGEASLSETGFLLTRNPDTVRAPDMAFVAKERLPLQFSEGFSQTIPDLVMEVVSPNDSWSKVMEKVQEWLAAGVRIVWVADPKARTVTIFGGAQGYRRLAEADTLDGGDLVPGFSLSVARIFV